MLWIDLFKVQHSVDDYPRLQVINLFIHCSFMLFFMLPVSPQAGQLVVGQEQFRGSLDGDDG